ncbi:hypothetical protein JCM8208_001048 [Rhodotorula glutinis]
MVRASAAGPAPPSCAPDYFDSLAELATFAAAPRARRRFAAPLVPFASTSKGDDAHRGRGKLVVCHDYKGGYSERDDDRGYTFSWWHLVDTFIYFSHHRVSCPPAGWVHAAHENGTKILGTLIFEHDAGKSDIVELVEPSSSSSSSGSSASSRLDRLSTRYADYLVDLAFERGFDGWLVNVEVELGGEGASDEQKEAHAAALVAWLRYLSSETRRRVPGGEIMWYDAVTTDGKLAWQNAVTERNLPFFDACDSMFLNYWWRQEHLASTVALLDKLGSSRHSGVHFGLDVFGRGTLAGGGFESWRAVHTIEQALSAHSASFSAALFAPGWTVEAESLSHSLSSPEAFSRWRADDDYLFSRMAPTPSTAPELARHERERCEQRGVLRARHLAAQTAPSASPIPLARRIPSPPSFDYDSPLAPPPGAELGVAHKPLAAFLPAPRPTPAPGARFYTDFSGGSGHAFFVEGERVLEHGWTDAGFACPAAGLAFHPPGGDGGGEGATAAAALVEYDAWEGERALELRVGAQAGGQVGEAEGATRSASIPLCAVALPELALGIELSLDVVWKAASQSSSPSAAGADVVPQLRPSTGGSGLRASSRSTVELSCGWRRTRVLLTVEMPSGAQVWHISVELARADVVLVGALHLHPSASPSTPSFALAPAHYDKASSMLQWDVDLRPSPLDSARSSRSASRGPERPRHYHLFHRAPAPTATTTTRVYLGTTSAQEFSLDLAVLGGRGEVVVLAVFPDARSQEQATAVDALSLSRLT